MAGFEGFQKRSSQSSSTTPTGQFAGRGFGKPRSTLPIQTKLTVGAPGDQYEQEADRVAEQVMSMPDSAIQQPVQREAMPEEEEIQTKPLAAGITPLVQWEAMPEEEEVQTKVTDPIQHEEMLEEEEPVQMKADLQRSVDGSLEAGESIESRLNSSKGGGSPLRDDVRSFMESRFGADFSQVQVHTGSDAVQMNRELNAQAFTHKQDIYFGAGKTPANDALTAHELTHVVQQSGTHLLPSPRDVQQKNDRSPRNYQARSDNETINRKNSFTKPAQSHNFLSTAGQPIIQAFDPRFHRQSVVEGLDNTGFSAEEIGQIYAANWERDFSQGHPYFGNIVLAWKELKMAAIQNHLTQSEISNFEGTVEQLLNLALTPGGVEEIKKGGIKQIFAGGVRLSEGKAYGGYNYYEHMDNPGDKELLKKPEGESIPQYMVDSREYIKANLFKAASAYRGDMAVSKAGQVASNFVAAEIKENRVKQRMNDSGDNVVPGEKPSTLVANETTEQAKRNPLTPSSAASTGQWKPEVADALGRASHALEDFFAHSNFVELAIGKPALIPVLTEIDDNGNRKTSNEELGTGTFGDPDKTHAISHKIRSIANEIDNERLLVNRVAGKTSINPRPDQIHIGSTDGVREEPSSTAATVKKAIATVEAVAIVAENIREGATLGSPAGVLGTLGGAYIGLHTGLRAAIRGVIITPRGTQMLRQVAELLEESSRKDAKEGSHTKLAKDQGEHENTPFERLKEIKFQLARELAIAADKEIFGRMRQVFDAPSPEAADVLLQGIYTNLNQMIARPEGHPLTSMIDGKRKEAEKALQEYVKQSVPQ